MATAQPSWHASSCLEKVLEHRFVAELTSALWLQGVPDFEVLRSEVDSHGYDLVIEAGGILRHIQLKAMVKGGKRRDVSVNVRLASKPSGCIVWLTYDPLTLAFGPFHWLGSLPGEPLPYLGTRLAKHTKGNADGAKNVRPGHRVVPRTAFLAVASIGELAGLLFGAPPDLPPVPNGMTDELELLHNHLARQREPVRWEWLETVRDGRFEEIPESLDWNSSVEFAHLVDGYGLVEELGLGDPFSFEWEQLCAAEVSGEWTGGPARLWALLFLEHRRWRTSPIDPYPEMIALLDRLCRQVRDSLTAS